MSKRKSRVPLPLAPRDPPPGSQAPSLAARQARLVPILPLLPVQPQLSQQIAEKPSYPAAHATPVPSINVSKSPEGDWANTDSVDGSKLLRSGKWIPEEEEYAQLLIALFEGGLVTDCDNGATLRSYLSQKLRCAPMRISKKFAGKGIGKMVYTCKFKHAHQQQHLQSPALKERIRATELKFLNAIDPAMSLSTPANQFPYPPSVAIPMPPALHAVPVVPMPPALRAVAAVPMPPVPLAVPMPPFPQAVAIPVPAAPLRAEDHAKQLHESYLRALQNKIDDENKARPSNGFSAAQSMPTTTSSSNVPLVDQAKMADIPDFLSGFERVVQSMNPPVSTMQAPPVPPMSNVLVNPPVATAMAANVSDLPQSTAVMTTNVSDLPHSPPFTSRSFDDFHRFLGTDLTLGLAVQTEETKNESATSQTSTSPIVPDTSALFAPESYAMFAQESALQTSLHGSAFLSRPGVVAAPLSHPPPVAFDVDGLLNQVREHTFGSAVPAPHFKETHKSRSHHKYRKREEVDEDKDMEPVKKPKKAMARHSVVNSSSSDAKAAFTVERFMRTSNLVSGSEPSGSSSSNSNSNHEESSSMDTAGTDDNSEEESNNYSDSSSGGEMEQSRSKKAKLVDAKSAKAATAGKNATTRQVQLDRR